MISSGYQPPSAKIATKPIINNLVAAPWYTLGCDYPCGQINRNKKTNYSYSIVNQAASIQSQCLPLSPCWIYSSRVQRLRSVGMTVCHPSVFCPARERAWTRVSRIRVTDVMIA